MPEDRQPCLERRQGRYRMWERGHWANQGPLCQDHWESVLPHECLLRENDEVEQQVSGLDHTAPNQLCQEPLGQPSILLGPLALGERNPFYLLC